MELYILSLLREEDKDIQSTGKAAQARAGHGKKGGIAMKIEIDFEEVMHEWATKHKAAFGPKTFDVSQITKAICDASINYYQAASFLIEGAFEFLPEEYVAQVLEEYGYTKQEESVPESDAARERRVDLCTSCQNTGKEKG